MICLCIQDVILLTVTYSVLQRVITPMTTILYLLSLPKLLSIFYNKIKKKKNDNINLYR